MLLCNYDTYLRVAENPMLLCNYDTYLCVAFFYQSIAPSRRRHAHRTVVPAARHLSPWPLASLSQRLTRLPPRATGLPSSSTFFPPRSLIALWPDFVRIPPVAIEFTSTSSSSLGAILMLAGSGAAFDDSGGVGRA
jgi:hypothetical protein